MLITRVLTGVVLAPLLYLVVWRLPENYFTALALLASGLGQHEIYVMARKRGVRPLEVLGILCGLLLLAAGPGLVRAPGIWGVFSVAFAVLAVFIVRLALPRPVEGALEDIGVTVLGIFYVSLFFGFQVLILQWMNGRAWLTFLYLVIWASDIGAYFVGTAFGKHRLYEKISPKKSIEGLVGGLAASAGVALCCRIWFFPGIGSFEIALLAVVLAVMGTIGDLAESLIKRGAGVKDSGVIIPGHGGILDRMDSMLFAAPLLFFYLTLK